MRYLTKLFSLASILLATLCFHLRASEVQVPFEIRGIVELNRTLRFSVRDQINERTRWLDQNQTYLELTLLGYDPTKQRVIAEYRGAPISLPLVLADNTSIPVVTNLAIPLAIDEATEKEIASKVAIYRTSEMEKLSKVNPHLRSVMAKSSENRVSIYAESLRAAALQEARHSTALAKVESPSKLEAAMEQDRRKNVRIGSLRTRNTVNSRIWASDHIEKFGTPKEAR